MGLHHRKLENDDGDYIRETECSVPTGGGKSAGVRYRSGELQGHKFTDLQVGGLSPSTAQNQALLGQGPSGRRTVTTVHVEAGSRRASRRR